MTINIENLPKHGQIDSLEIWSEECPEIKNDTAKEFAESIFANSPYLSKLLIRNFDFFEETITIGFQKSLDSLLNEIKEFKLTDKESLSKFLRQSKEKAALLIAMAEISDFWDISTTTEKLSIFADLCVTKASEFLFINHHKLGNIELEDINNPLENCGITIIALGKLGSNELNYSSDIDIAFFFKDQKLTYKGKKNLQIFYIDFVKELIELISKRTEHGYVFRIDVRLRPDPASNPVAISLEKAENYYFTVGQNWERAAMIKARPICGDDEASEIFLGFNNQNVWRRALDFETIEDIHSIKRQIDTKTPPPSNDLYKYNIKLSRGGIREIEFFCQTQQLIWGGRKPVLRDKKTLQSLDNLLNIGEIEEQAHEDLAQAYIFYRMVEHRLQMINDEQTHNLPNTPEKFKELAIFCGFDDEIKFTEILKNHINNVSNHYAKLFETSPSLAISDNEVGGSLVFTGIENHPETIKTLTNLGFNEADKICEIVRGWHHGRYECTKKKRSRAVLTKLMPYLIQSFSKSPYPDLAFTRFDEFLGRVPEGSQIFSMLYMNPSIMNLLAEIMGGYQHLALSLVKNPTLLDYVLAPEFYNRLPDLKYLQDNIEESLSTVDKQDIENIFETIKDWANDRKFRVGIQLLREEINSNEVAYCVSNIAETVILTLQKYIQEDFENNFGEIKGGKFTALAFGKLGSKELTFNSDLDLVFIYDFPNDVFSSDKSNVNPSSYYIRMANKIVYALSSISRTGKLYEVDLRLRPLGESGPIATSLTSFEQYYNTNRSEGSAWIWEYMALTRARPIGISEEFNEKVLNTIKGKLYHRWDDELLHNEAKYIYTKFRESNQVDGELDVKRDLGGIFDLEFMVKFLQLKYLNEFPDIYNHSISDTITSIKKAEIITEQDSIDLLNAHECFKDLQNVLRITSELKINNYTKKLLSRSLNVKNYAEVQKILEFHKSKIKNLFDKYLQY